MGNLICGLGRKKTSEVRCDSNDYTDVDTRDRDTQKDAAPKEEVLYATIDHGNGKTAGNMVKTEEADDCDYAVVKIPTENRPSIKEDCSDDYVLMG
ncbi:hypothetical protein ACEWY4_022902 [Coilia grayii]|uniref:Uncharacterized protein n=1 Tax=Coilia grayii TaxID=363190 RepID=A0ABD1J1G8_9TELE